jgi:2-methylcitrate dehydratase PrpD
MDYLSTKFAAFACGLRFEDLSHEVVLQAKKAILDLVGVALAGYPMEFPTMVVDYIAGLGGKPEATIIRKRKKYPAMNAALANGVCAHALDMDDGYRYGGVHPASPTVPAAIAAAELQGSSGKDLITATVAGFEVLLRTSRAINPSHLSRGFHTTGTVGPFGAVVAVGKLIGLRQDEMVSAIGIAGLQGAGLLEILHDGAMVKPIHPGKAAMAGLLAAIFARNGAKGPASIFEGQKGFLGAMADKTDHDALLRGLGEEFEILGTYFKLHAACRHTHPIIDAALEICTKNGLGRKDIKGIEIETYPVAVQFCGHTVHPDTVSAAKFSIPFSVAMAISFGDLFMDKFTEENIRDDGIKELAAKVKVHPGEKWARDYPDKRGASVTIKTFSGQSHSSSVPLAKGERENPATLEDLIEKFRTNSTQVLSKSRSRKLEETVMNLENCSVNDITCLL